jgi:hypothetical protein
MPVLKTARDLRMMFVAVTDSVEELRLETVFALQVQCVICLVVTRLVDVSILGQECL